MTPDTSCFFTKLPERVPIRTADISKQYPHYANTSNKTLFSTTSSLTVFVFIINKLHLSMTGVVYNFKVIIYPY